MLEHNLYASAIESCYIRDRKVWKRGEWLWCNWRSCHYQYFPVRSVFFRFVSFLFQLFVCVCFPHSFRCCSLFRAHTSLFWQRNYRHFVCVCVFFCAVCSRLSNFIENGSDKLFALDIFVWWIHWMQSFQLNTEHGGACGPGANNTIKTTRVTIAQESISPRLLFLSCIAFFRFVTAIWSLSHSHLVFVVCSASLDVTCEVSLRVAISTVHFQHTHIFFLKTNAESDWDDLLSQIGQPHRSVRSWIAAVHWMCVQFILHCLGVECNCYSLRDVCTFEPNSVVIHSQPECVCMRCTAMALPSEFEWVRWHSKWHIALVGISIFAMCFVRRWTIRTRAFDASGFGLEHFTK